LRGLVQRFDADSDPDPTFFLEANPDPASYLDRAKNTQFTAKKHAFYYDSERLLVPA
jgi:hypothetical protein